jgi:hypothetical protein
MTNQNKKGFHAAIGLESQTKVMKARDKSTSHRFERKKAK